MLQKILMLCIILSPQVNSSSLVDKFFVKPCKTLLHGHGTYEVDEGKTITKKIASADGTLRNVLYAAYKHSPEVRLQRAVDVEEATKDLTYGLGGALCVSALVRMLSITSDRLHKTTAIALEFSSVAFVLMLGKNYFDSTFKNELDYRMRLAKHNNDKDAMFNLAWKKI